MQMSLRVLGLALPLLSGQPALANGTSVGASLGSPLGGIVPLQNKQVRLVSEKLTITLRDGATCVKEQSGTNVQRVSCTTRHYDVLARYTLSNPEREATVLYGVPLVARQDKAPAMARGVRIRVGSREHRCTIPVQPPRAPESLTDVEEIVAGLRKESAGAFEGMAWVGAWCVAPITIPRGERVVLELRYTGELLWDDWDGPGCAYFGRSRHLLYPLAPAGYWAGRPEAVDIRVELGRHGGITRVVGPAGHRRSPSFVEWRLVQPELKKVAPIHLVLDLTWHQHARIARMNEAWRGALSLEPAAGTRSLVDGKASTGFCAPSGTSLELRLAEHPYWYTNVYLELRNAQPRDLQHPMAMSFPRGVTERIKANPRAGELELHGRLPGPLWGTRAQLGFALVPDRGTDRPRRVRLGLCDRPEIVQEHPLSDSRLDGPGAERGRRVITVLRPSGVLRDQVLARLDTWSQELARAARPCVATCPSGCKASPLKKKGERDERALACRLKCELECVHATAHTSAPGRRPCLRFSFDWASGKGSPKARGPACLSEIVPLFGSPCGVEDP